MMSTFTVLKRQRGVIKRSVTNLVNSLRRLEANAEDPSSADEAKRLISKLDALDKEFRAAHLEVISALDDDSPELEPQYEVMDKHEDDVAAASLRLQALLKPALSSADRDVSSVRPLSRKLSRVERSLRDTEASLALLDGDHDEIPLLENHQEKLSDLKKELYTLYEELIALDLPDDHELLGRHEALEAQHFSCSYSLKKLLKVHPSRSTGTPTATTDKTCKLPKLDVPTFDGDILRWQQFWEQFKVSIHSRSSLSNAEKLVYLQQALKGGSARKTIEGLSQTGDHYEEAIKCLKSRYNRPRLIHRAHVRTIVDTPPLRDGSGKELRHFHDVLQQHLRALRTMKTEPDPSFVTSIIELKLDETTLFEWQKHSQGTIDKVPHYQDMLDFLDLRAQASETLSNRTKRSGVTTHSRKTGTPNKETSFAAANSDPSRGRCVICPGTERHPLYACSQFKAMSHEDKLSLLKRNNLCMNCFSSGH